MRFTRRFGSGRGRLSLRSRLLAGLLTVTALFLIIMGVVTTVVIGNTEQDQFTTDLLLTAKSTPKEIANAASGYVAANVSARTGQVTLLTPTSRNATDLQEWLASLVAQGGAYAYLKSNDGQVFHIGLPNGGSAVAATVRAMDLDAVQSGATGGLLPVGHEAPPLPGGRSIELVQVFPHHAGGIEPGQQGTHGPLGHLHPGCRIKLSRIKKRRKFFIGFDRNLLVIHYPFPVPQYAVHPPVNEKSKPGILKPFSAVEVFLRGFILCK